MSRIKDILNYEITPRRPKNEKTAKRKRSSLSIDYIKILMFLAGPIGFAYYLTAYRKVQLKRMLTLFTHIRMIVQNNAPLPAGLAIVAEDAPSSHLRAILEGVGEEIEQGAKLSEALRKYSNTFQDRYIALIELGERTGRMEQSLANVVESLNQRLVLRSSIYINLSYICFVLLAQLTIGSFIVVKVLPVFVEIFGEFGMGIPYTTQLLFDTVNQIDSVIGSMGDIGILVYTFALPIICTLLYRRTIFFRSIVTTGLSIIPFFGPAYRAHNRHLISQGLSELLSGHVPLPDAFRSASTSAIAPPYRKALENIANELENGASLQDAMPSRSFFLGNTFCAVLSLGNTAGTLPQSASQLTQLYSRELYRRITITTDAMLPVYAVGGGAINLWLLLSTWGMIFGMTDALTSTL